MMSLNMLIEFGDAFDFTGADFAGWCREAGFRDVEILPLTVLRAQGSPTDSGRCAPARAAQRSHLTGREGGRSQGQDAVLAVLQPTPDSGGRSHQWGLQPVIP